MNNVIFDFDRVDKLFAKDFKKYTNPQEEKSISDCLIIGVDFATNENENLVVMIRDGIDTYVVNQFKNEEALELYNKLIGVKNE